VNEGNDIYYRNGLRGEWKITDGRSRQVAVGPGGLLAVTPKGDVYHRIGTYEDPVSEGTSWHQLSGDNILYASWGKSVAWSVDFAYGIWYTYIQGTPSRLSFSWIQIPGTLKQISSSPGILKFKTEQYKKQQKIRITFIL